MVRKVLVALLVAAALSGSASFQAPLSPSSTVMADGTGLPKCC